MNASPSFLQPGDRASFQVYSRKCWNDTGIWLEAGAEYRYEVPETETWYDFWISTTANGYSRASLKKWEPYRRVKAENWFRLIGTIDQKMDFAIVLGCGPNTFTSPATGQLSCFANDMCSMYWNNWGGVQGTISPV